MQLIKLRYRGLNEGPQRDGLIGAHRNVAHPEFDRVKERMRPNVPPDLLRVIDAVGLNQELDEVLVLAPTGKIIRNVGSRKLVKHLATVRLEASIHPQPERRVRR